MTQNLRVDVLSDQDYEDLIAECYVGEDCVMVVNQERGLGELEVEVLVRPDGQSLRIDYDAMLELLQNARARLCEVRRVAGGEEDTT